MAIIEKVTLVDDYSAKAKKIEASTSAMDRIRGNANKIEQALKSAFSRSYEVDIKETGSKYLESRVEGLKKSLDGLNKPYEVSIRAKEGVLDKVKANLSSIKDSAKSIKKPFESAFTSAKSFKMDVSSFRKAQREAKQIGKEISAFTGKQHKVHINMENPIKSAFKGGFSKMFGGIKSGFSKVGGFFSKLNPFKGFGGGGGASGGGGESPGLIKSIVGGNLITGAITKGIGAIGNVASSTLGAGFNRLTSIESSQARLRGFGYDNKQIGQITKSATAAVTGTQYSMGDAMTASSGAIAAGIKPGELEGYLKEVGNAAAATGSDFNDVASIMNKVKTTGHLQADEMMQLSDRGLPVLAKLAEQAGVSADEMQDRISKGLVGFDEFRNAVKSASGTAAEEVAKTWGGAKDNFKSALGKIGAGLLGGKQGKDGEQGGLFGLMTPALLKMNDVLNGLVPTFQNAGDAIKDFAVTGFNKLKDGFGKVGEFMKPAMDKFKEGFGKVSDKFGEIIGPLKEKLTTAFDGLKEAFNPLKDAISNLFGDGVEGGMDIFTTMIDLAGQGLTMLAEAVIAATPVIQSVIEWVSANVIPVIGEVVSWISGTLIPAISEVVSTIMGALIPIFQSVADFIGTYVVPAFETIANTVLTVAEPVFHAIATAVEWAVGKFNDLVGAVGAAANALFGLPGKIAGMVGDAVGGAVSSVKNFFGFGKNATGTQYFSGGLTRINERGEEMIQLARGDKIYPAGKTDKIIKNEIKNTKLVDRSISSPNVTINVNGANMTNKDVAKVISDEFKRLGVLV